MRAMLCDAVSNGLALRANQCPVKRQSPRLFEHIQNGFLDPADRHSVPRELAISPC